MGIDGNVGTGSWSAGAVPERRLPMGGLNVLDVRTEKSMSVSWGGRLLIGRRSATPSAPERGGAEGPERHVDVDDGAVSRVAAEVEVREDAYLIVCHQRHRGQLTVFVPGVLGKERVREGNGVLVRDRRLALGLWLPDGRELPLVVLTFAPSAAYADRLERDGSTEAADMPTTEAWWTILVAACGPTLISASSRQPQQDVPGDAHQIAAWHAESGRIAPSAKVQSDAFRHAARWLRGVRLSQRTHGRRVAVIEQAVNLRLVTLDDVAALFPRQIERSRPADR